MAQEISPVFASDYAKKVEDFARVSVSRTATGWRVRGVEHVHTLRAPAVLRVPQIRASESVGGFSQRGEDVYVHMAGASAELLFAPIEPTEVRLVSANARIESIQKTTTGYRWNLIGHVPLEFTLAHADNCKVRAAGQCRWAYPLQNNKPCCQTARSDMQELMEKRRACSWHPTGSCCWSPCS